MAAAPDPTYACSRNQQEHERLKKQARAFAPLTEALFREAGLTVGMRVLDIGCGVGDVSILAAKFAGPTGEVIGIDQDAASLAIARQRAAELALENVRFVQGDFRTHEFERAFDAAVGRLVLMYQASPAEALRALAAHVNSGGIIAMHEGDWTRPLISHPPAPLYNQCGSLVIETLRRSGAHTDIGLSLYPTFIAAGLPPPLLRIEAVIDGGPQCIGYEILAETVRSVLPVARKLGVPGADEIDGERLTERLRAEGVALGGVVASPLMVGAWCRKNG